MEMKSLLMDGDEMKTVLGATGIEQLTCTISINTAVRFTLFSAF